ncbi:MAG: hypothetical protein EXQ85_08255 [Alphaproteobacteria bacterium]|nr:hypothetical protein [Alphaproteobacteria bacterium]
MMVVADLRVRANSRHHKILRKLCDMPKPVRGISDAMLNRAFGAPRAIQELAQAGLIRQRGWHDGPGGVWVPTEAGEEVCRKLAEPDEAPPPAVKVRRGRGAATI